MTPLDRVKRDIAAIAASQKNVRIGDINAIVNQLQRHPLGYSVSVDGYEHGTRYIIGDVLPFTITTHNPGSSQLRPIYVRKFLDAMAELGLYEG